MERCLQNFTLWQNQTKKHLNLKVEVMNTINLIFVIFQSFDPSYVRPAEACFNSFHAVVKSR